MKPFQDLQLTELCHGGISLLETVVNIVVAYIYVFLLHYLRENLPRGRKVWQRNKG